MNFPKKKNSIQPKKTVKACNNNGLVNSANCNIFPPDRYENLDNDDTNSNTTFDITDTYYNKETVNNHMAKNKFNQNHQNIVHRRTQVVVNQHPDNQTVFNRLPIVPGKSSYKVAADGKKFHERNISIFSDSIPKGIRWKEFNSYVKFGKARFFGFPGGNSKQLSSYIDVNLENSNPDTVIIHVRINDLLDGSNEPQIDILIENIGTIIGKCRLYGITSIFISGLVYTTRVRLSILEET